MKIYANVSTTPCGTITLIQTNQQIISDDLCSTSGIEVVRTFLLFDDLDGDGELNPEEDDPDHPDDAVSCTLTYVIRDLSLPEITCPKPVTISCDASLNPSENDALGEATATDNCGGEIEITYEDDSRNSPAVITPAPLPVPGQQQTPVNYRLPVNR